MSKDANNDALKHARESDPLDDADRTPGSKGRAQTAFSLSGQNSETRARLPQASSPAQRDKDDKDSLKPELSEVKANAQKGSQSKAKGEQSKLSETDDSAQSKLGEMKENAQTKLSEMKESAKEKFAELKESAQAKLSDTKEKLSDAKENAKDKLSDAKESAKDKLSDAKESAKDKLSDAKESAKDKLSDAKEAAQSKQSDAKVTPESKLRIAQSKLNDAKEKSLSLSAKETAQSKLSDAEEASEEKLADVKENVQAQLESAKSKLSDVKESVEANLTKAEKTLSDGAKGIARERTEDTKMNAESVKARLTSAKEAASAKLASTSGSLKSDKPSDEAKSRLDSFNEVENIKGDKVSKEDAADDDDDDDEAEDAEASKATKKSSSALREGERQAAKVEQSSFSPLGTYLEGSRHDHLDDEWKSVEMIRREMETVKPLSEAEVQRRDEAKARNEQMRDARDVEQERLDARVSADAAKADTKLESKGALRSAADSIRSWWYGDNAAAKEQLDDAKDSARAAKESAAIAISEERRARDSSSERSRQPAPSLTAQNSTRRSVNEDESTFTPMDRTDRTFSPAGGKSYADARLEVRESGDDASAVLSPQGFSDPTTDLSDLSDPLAQAGALLERGAVEMYSRRAESSMA